MRKISEKRLQKNIETALYKLLTGKGAPTKEQRDEQGQNQIDYMKDTIPFLDRG